VVEADIKDLEKAITIPPRQSVPGLYFSISLTRHRGISTSPRPSSKISWKLKPQWVMAIARPFLKKLGIRFPSCSRIRFRRVVWQPQSWGIAEWGAVRCSRKVTRAVLDGTLEAASSTIDQRCSLCEHSLLDSSGVGGVGTSGRKQSDVRAVVRTRTRGHPFVQRRVSSPIAQRKSPDEPATAAPRAVRLLFTLETLGYVGVDGREFSCSPEYSISGTRSSRVNCPLRHRRALRPGLE